MRNINLALFGGMTLFALHSSAITIEEVAEKNNQIIELDQEIAIAKKNKELIKLKSETQQPEVASTPAFVTPTRNESMAVLAVHGSLSDPTVDIQYGEMLLHKRHGESLPNGWKISAIGKTTVTFNKKGATKTVSIGQGMVSTSEDLSAATQPPITAPSR